MIVLARLEAEASELSEVIADLDRAEDAVRNVLTHETEISDEHYERMAAGEAHPSYFKGRRVFKIPSITTPRMPRSFIQGLASASSTAATRSSHG